MNEQTHVMVLEHTHSDGTEEWACPTCGRRILVEWPPAYRKVVLEEGDVNATHSGSKGGLQLSAHALPAQDAEEIPAATRENDIVADVDAQTLEPWMEWMDAVGFEDLWQDGPARSG